jgi:hypothetical protein
VSEHTDNLRKALLKLDPTGPAGFEGLLGATLTEIIGVPFRVAGSGSQFGLDGKPAYEQDAVYFECKRYDGNIPKTEVLSKISELIITNTEEIDLWVLGATTPVISQHADAVRKLGELAGISTLILDWTDTGIPPLAAALAMSQEAARTFIKAHVKNSDLAAKAVTALEAIRKENGFANHAARIRALLEEPTIGAGLAKETNREWLTDVFSDKPKARRFLRQGLSPGDKAAGEPALRPALLGKLGPLVTGKPDGKVIAIIGEEGAGESWLVGQTWLSLTDKPLMVFFTADDFSEAAAAGNLREILIDKLIAQTDGKDSEAARQRWRRKLEQWREHSTTDKPHLVAVIDGLNQRPRMDWARLIEAMGSELDRIGGRLIVTVRTAYYTSRIRQRLYSAAVEVTVPEWTDQERDSLLAARGIRGADLRPQVAASLRNPRLLGIALELLHNAKIEELEELSVSRLLFEHILASESDAPSPRPAAEFARKLQDHARDILKRVAALQRDDLTIFEGALEAVTDGRFFVPVTGDATRYRFNEDGFTLALGFAVLDELRKAHRNGHDLAEALAAIIDPVSALDLTAEALFAALTVACLDEECPVEICAVIIAGFAELQNPNAEEFPAFAALAKKRPEPFMHAAKRMCLTSSRQSNFDWIEAALHAAKADADAWSLMTPMLQSWLAHYSLSPEARMVSHRSRDPADKVEQERAKRQNEIERKLGALSASEREVLGLLVRDDTGDIASLARLALTLIAGKPVAPFAPALVQWSFAHALNAELFAPRKEFMHLIRLNRVDWRQTREAILNACGMFETADVSHTGKWTLADMLRATGDPDDAARARPLFEELTADWPKFGSWRFVERYCATDPCDPASTKPQNIAKTAENYAEIDVSKIRLGMSNSEVDSFFIMACPAIVRFEHGVGIVKHHEFIANVLERHGFPLRQGIFELRNHNALVTREHAERIVGRVKAGTAGGADEGIPENDRWVVSAYHLLVAFPLLGATEQIETMLAEHADDHMLCDLMEVAKPLDEQTFEALLNKAVVDNDERAQFILLVFAASTATPVSQKARRHLSTLAQARSERVRAQALNLIAKTGDEPSIEAIAKSGWSATNIHDKSGYEIWYGSCVVVEAAARGMVSHDQALDRITPQLYGWAATRLGAEAARNVARRIDYSIKKAADLALDLPVPDIELPQKRNRDITEPTRYIVSEKPSESADTFDALQQLAEPNAAFEERQKRAREAFQSFTAELTKTKACIILGGLTIQEFDTIAQSDRTLAESWYDLFMGLPKSRRAAIHNLGLLLAHALADWAPDKAVRLFRRLRDSDPSVRTTFGAAGISLDAMTLWGAKNETALDKLRFDRLDRAGNDDEIAVEVLAALWNGKRALIEAYIERQLQTGEPSAIARALMVAGLSDDNKFNDEVLARYKDKGGFIRQVHEAAMYAYERNRWSAHWFTLMREAQQPEDFWRHATLLAKIVDGRFELWKSASGNVGEPYCLFGTSIESRLLNRQKKWRSKRDKTLFGDTTPSKVFLPVTDER